MKLLLLLVGMVLIVEGLPYAVAPEKMREWLLTLSELPPATMRVFGFVSLGCGLLICWIVQKTSLFS
jgi:uncharacterized protein YjeT (DUF2065 family)